MSIWLREKDLAGFSEYMLNKSNEERGHASRMIDYLLDCDEQVILPTIQSPQRAWDSTQALFDQVSGVPWSGVTPSAPPPRLRRGGPRTSGDRLHG